MRGLLLIALVPFFGASARAGGQADTGSRRADSAASREVAPQVQRAPNAKPRDLGSLSDVLDRARDNPLMPRLPSASSITRGNLTIDAGQTVPGPVAVFEGTLTVRGRERDPKPRKGRPSRAV